jgi:hypothetical protein
MRPTRKPKPDRIPAGLTVIPYDPIQGQAGEWTVNAPSEPQPAPVPVWRPPPPDWELEAKEQAERERLAREREAKP